MARYIDADKIDELKQTTEWRFSDTSELSEEEVISLEKLRKYYEREFYESVLKKKKTRNSPTTSNYHQGQCDAYYNAVRYIDDILAMRRYRKTKDSKLRSEDE